jgi:hypothetical protein
LNSHFLSLNTNANDIWLPVCDSPEHWGSKSSLGVVCSFNPAGNLSIFWWLVEIFPLRWITQQILSILRQTARRVCLSISSKSRRLSEIGLSDFREQFFRVSPSDNQRGRNHEVPSRGNRRELRQNILDIDLNREDVHCPSALSDLSMIFRPIMFWIQWDRKWLLVTYWM